MKNGHIIYDAEGAARNEWFINRLICFLRQRGLVADLKTVPYAFSKIPDFAVVRTINPELTAELESRGVRVFNNSLTARIANNKWLTYNMCLANGIPVMQTNLLTENAGTEFPCVAKTVDGHGGKEVFWIDNREELENMRKTVGDKRVILQKPCSEPGKDKRVYLIGGEITAAVLRTAKSGFKSNYSLGGKAELCGCAAEEREIAKKVCRLLKADFTAVDFIYDGGKPILNEIEDCAGTRMLYANSDIDAAEIFAEHIFNSVNRVNNFCADGHT